MPSTSPPLSSLLPPLVFGTATFNSQYNPDPSVLHTTDLVHHALSLGVRAFDTSPYYGPSENLLGQALDSPFVRDNFPRRDYFVLTKVGRIAGSEFDYSAGWVRQSVQRSLRRLKTGHLDLVYCHDVEFVSAEDVLTAVSELRRIRDETGTVRYVGISGYPVSVLCDRAEMILEKTGEPLDAVMSYCNYTLQSTRLGSVGLARLQTAKVDVVLNASVLGMGLLRRTGVPIGGQGNWHPAPDALRAVVADASKHCDAQGDKIENVAIRYALENWMREGRAVGSRGDRASGIPWDREKVDHVRGQKLGVSVMGVSHVEELDETIRVWRSILDTMEGGEKISVEAGRTGKDREWGLQRQREVQERAQEIRDILGTWFDYAWPSPGEGFVNQRGKKDAP